MKKTTFIKSILSSVLVPVLIIFCAPGNLMGQIVKGEITKALTWQVTNDDGFLTLIISGSGNIPDYQYDEQPWFVWLEGLPWGSSFDALILGEGINRIGNRAFRYLHCWDIINFENSLLTIPNSVTSIGEDAFSNCGFTGSLTIPNSVISIEDGAFQYCTGFTGILTIPNSVISLSGFNQCIGFTGTLTIPNSVEIIGIGAFAGCTGFAGSLTIPNSVTEIREFAFSGCTGFSGSLILGNSLTIIGDIAFGDLFYQSCNFTGSLTIPNSVKTIGSWAFTGCIGFTGSLTIGNSVTSIGYRAFGSLEFPCNFTGSLSIPNSVKTIGGDAFLGCSGFSGSLIIPNSVEIIGQRAFESCNGISGLLTIPENVNEIGFCAFNFSSLHTVHYNAINCETNGGCYFYQSNPLTLNIGSNVQTIPKSAFRGTKLSSLSIPKNVISIGDHAFYGCNDITSITSQKETPPTLGVSAFPNISQNIPVIVPCNSFGAYANSDWKSYFNIFNKQSEICMVSVDDNNHNVIVCNSGFEYLDCYVGYDIYRESAVGGQYDLVHTIPANTTNAWVDTESNAKIRSYRYKMAYKINDYGLTNLSNAHKTMHLTINSGINNSWNLIWTAYEGAEYSSYNIYRSSGENLGELQLIGTMPAGNSTFSDFGAPAGYVYYMVEIMLNETCDIGKIGSSIKSNIATNNPNVGIASTTLSNQISVFPNPTTGQLTIDNGQLKVNNVIVFDVYGRKLLSNHLIPTSSNHHINISHLSAGVYFVKIMTESGEVIKKVLREP